MSDTNFTQHSPTGKQAEYLNQLVDESDQFETPEDVIDHVLENDGSTTGIFGWIKRRYPS